MSKGKVTIKEKYPIRIYPTSFEHDKLKDYSFRRPHEGIAKWCDVLLDFYNQYGEIQLWSKKEEKMYKKLIE